MPLKIKARILDIMMHEFSGRTFSACIMNSITSFVHKDLVKGVSFHYAVPENLCRKHLISGKDIAPQFSAAAIMALFDEVSTYSTTMKDRWHRPGLSVHLTTEIIKPVYAGDDVTVLTSADKNGKTIGYCSMEMLNQRGELVARGKHIRYIHMDIPGFKIITHSLIIPWVLNFYEYFHGKKRSPDNKNSARGTEREFDGKSMFKLPAGFPSIDGVGRVFEILGLKKLSAESSQGNVSTVSESSSSNSSNDGRFHGTQETSLSTILCSDNGRIEPSAYLSYGMTVVPITSNLTGRSKIFLTMNVIWTYSPILNDWFWH
jgi:hypothetical protein